ncbi:MAG: uncharacterized BrkB/YihY/UPF0761 family membrane protein [Cryomorphaceae bacterium]|jgi:uncharacterized BrkB/YihY/UPF0761 family membrane protein
MDDLEIDNKCKFWRRVLILGILVLVLALLTMVSLYLSGMSDAKAQAGADYEWEQEIAMLAARSELLLSAGKWTLPFAILASLMMNVARYKLRKLKKNPKCQKIKDYTH